MDARRFLSFVLGLMLCLRLWSQDEDPVVTQTLRWTAVEGASAYELKVWTAMGVVTRLRVEAPMVVLQLKPGQYLYSIAVYNVLDQPEAESLPRELVVLRAEVPRPEALVPGQMDASDPVRRFVLRGSLFVEGASVNLVTADGARVTPAHVVERSDGQWLLEFPGANLSPGQYDLVVQNPGGLQRTLRGALRVNAERAFEVRLAGGWMGALPILDPWFLEVWGNDFVSQGWLGRADLVFVKQPSYQVGIGLDTRLWNQGHEVDAIVLSSDFLAVGIEGFSSWLVNRSLHASARLGAGVIRSRHVFEYEFSAGTSWESLDPYASLELNGSYWFTRWLYLEAGVDLSLGFNNGYVAGLVRPLALLGLSY